MGRIKTKLVKRKTMDLIKSHGEEFSTDFDSNKKQAERFMDFPSKKIRNVIAGYVTRLKRKEA
jgi:small subunit ribosomal protein S17e